MAVLPVEKGEKVLREFDIPLGIDTDPIQRAGAVGVEESLQSGQGFASSASVRQALEDHSMERANDYFRKRGFEVEDVSVEQPYDLRCEQGDLTVHVEVKGTQTDGSQVILTANEVEFAREHTARMVLFIVHGVEIEGDAKNGVSASGGERRVYEPWDVDQGVLSVINYRYEPPTP